MGVHLLPDSAAGNEESRGLFRRRHRRRSGPDLCRVGVRGLRVVKGAVAMQDLTPRRGVNRIQVWKNLEAGAGIEPAYTALQAAA